MIENRVGVARFTGSTVEVEVLGRTLLEPQPVVIGCVLQELGSLLQQLLALTLALVFGVSMNPGSTLGRLLRRMGKWRLTRARLVLRFVVEALVIEEVRPVNGGLLPHRLGGQLKIGRRIVLIYSGLGMRRGELVLEGPAVILVLSGRVVGDHSIGRLHRLQVLIELGVFGSLNSPHRPQRLALVALDFAGISAAAALEV
jgi:hypothetical protein